jgi:hypothetical protein
MQIWPSRDGSLIACSPDRPACQSRPGLSSLFLVGRVLGWPPGQFAFAADALSRCVLTQTSPLAVKSEACPLPRALNLPWFRL